MKLDRGVLAALSAAVLFGLSTPLAKQLVDGVAPLMLSGLLYTGSGLGLGLLLLIRATTAARANITRPHGIEILWWAGAIIAGGAIAPYLLMYGLTSVDSASASLTLNLESVFTALLAWIAFRENVGPRIAFGMACIVAGGVVLSVSSSAYGGSWLGPIAITGACLAWALDNNLTRKVSIHDAMLIACAKGLIAGPVSIAIAIGADAPIPDYSRLIGAAIVGFIGYGLSLTLFVLALRRLGTARTGAYFSLAPFIGAGLAVVLGAPLTAALLVSAVLMGIGLWLHLTERHVHTHEHEELSHDHVHEHDEHHQHRHDADGEVTGAHSHVHRHERQQHTHAHYPDAHHGHKH